ncbi:preprotein translocase subunit YajC [Gordonia caeni]
MDGLFLPLILALAVAFLFISFRNQKKRTAAMAELKAQAVPGARVQLSCGLFGTLHSDDGGDTVDVEIAPGVITTWNRLAIREVVAEQPAPGLDDLDDSVAGDSVPDDASSIFGDDAPAGENPADENPAGTEDVASDDSPVSPDDNDSKDK